MAEDDPPPLPSIRRRPILRWLLGLAAGALAGGLLVAAINFHMLRASRARTFFRVEDVPARPVAIVLGTAPHLRNRRANPFFESRMDAAARLWHAEKTRHFIVSGDNSRRTYDEPTAMREALVARGVPAAAITPDYAGFRTLDTMARARAVFAQRAVIVVTDDFHLPRSLFLAAAHGLDAVGFGGKPVPIRWSKKTRTREIGSRVKAWLDVHVLRTQPKFFGPPVAIPES